MCKEGWQLRMTYLATQRPLDRAIYTDHLQRCPQCHAHLAAQKAQAERARMPEMAE